MTADPDPRGLIAEAYNIPGIGEAECRSIFLDWVLGLPEGTDAAALAASALARPEIIRDHPMTAVLESATRAGEPPRRRGGRARITGATPPPPTRGR